MTLLTFIPLRTKTYQNRERCIRQNWRALRDMFSMRILTLFFAILNVKVGNGQRINTNRESNLNEIEIELIEGKSLSHFFSVKSIFM